LQAVWLEKEKSSVKHLQNISGGRQKEAPQSKPTLADGTCIKKTEEAIGDRSGFAWI
jgi:hypothetical protein